MTGMRKHFRATVDHVLGLFVCHRRLVIALRYLWCSLLSGLAVGQRVMAKRTRNKCINDRRRSSLTLRLRAGRLQNESSRANGKYENIIASRKKSMYSVSFSRHHAELKDVP